jgi:hypothetical protein
MEIWAGAAQCDIYEEPKKGVEVGSATIQWGGDGNSCSDSEVLITIQASGGSYFEGSQIYAGTSKLLVKQQGRKCVFSDDPGQFPTKVLEADFTNDGYWQNCVPLTPVTPATAVPTDVEIYTTIHLASKHSCAVYET